MKPIWLLLLGILGFQSVSAQNQTNVWYFGLFAGLDFNSGAPVVLTNGNTDTNEGTASICDDQGNLLFYTEGVHVWNRNNVLMPNGTGLKGDVSTTQTIIVPNPGDSNLYYIFTLDDQFIPTAGGTDGLNYSMVDMRLDGGNGDVSVKNTSLHANMTEKVCAVYHCNNHDIWVMTHEFGTNAFLAYLVTDNGIEPPLISNVGETHTEGRGQMKFTSDGKKLACALNGQEMVEIFDFDNKTGILSNPDSINIGRQVYGLEFSPDNTKLYVSSHDDGYSELYQYDMTAADIAASVFTFGTEFDDPNFFYGMQLASDGKIYISKNPTPFLYAINAPNLAGAACDYVPNAIYVDPDGFGVTAKLGLPGFIQSYFHPDFPFEECNDIEANFTATDTLLCAGDCVDFTESSACTSDSWQWTFDGATPGSSLAQNPTNVCYTTAGTYDVQLIASNGCIEDTVVKTIIVSAPSVDGGEDLTIGLNDSGQLNATGNVTSFSWSPAAGLSATDIANPVASPTVTTTYTVVGTDDNDCTTSDTVRVMVQQSSECGSVGIPDAFSPDNAGVNNELKVLGNCIETMRFRIYNRWGQKVFETNDQSIGWDGTFNGEPAPISTFAYYFEGTLTTGETVIRTGSVTLVR